MKFIKDYFNKRKLKKEINNEIESYNSEPKKETVKGNKSSILSVASGVMILGSLSYTLSPQIVNEMASLELQTQEYLQAQEQKRPMRSMKFNAQVQRHLDSLNLSQEDRYFMEVRQERFWQQREAQAGGFLNDARKRTIVENLTDNQRKHFGFPEGIKKVQEYKEMATSNEGVKIKQASKPRRSLNL